VDESAQVVVVGGGLSGTLLARWLTDGGAKTRLIDPEGGPRREYLFQGLHLPYGLARKYLGADRARDLVRLTVEGRKMVPGTVCGSRRLGANDAKLLHADGFEGEWRDGALVVPGDVVVEPTFPSTRARAVRIDDGGPRIRVVLDRGQIECEAVVLAAGAGSGALHTFLESAIYPGRRRWVVEPGTPLPTISADGRAITIDGPERREWTQTVALSCDEIPDVGPIPGSARIFVCAGFHGNSLGPACARMLADVLLTGKTAYPIGMMNPRRHAL
jgi:glycine/D-amino acid oxidase-like deaminating enzyme